jgi:hypothetical protein
MKCTALSAVGAIRSATVRIAMISSLALVVACGGGNGEGAGGESSEAGGGATSDSAPGADTGSHSDASGSGGDAGTQSGDASGKGDSAVSADGGPGQDSGTTGTDSGSDGSSSGDSTTCTDKCSAGATQCSGGQIQTCATQPDGCTDWSAPTACPSGESCTGNQCTSQPCTPGSLQCSGSVLQVCDSGGHWATQQVCSQGCDTSTNACTTTVTCTAQTQRCDGNVVEVCNSTGTAWLSIATCASGCGGGLCTGACTPGATRCNGNTPETCNTAGNAWTQGTACTTTCVGGGCSSPGITVNANANATLGGVTYVDGDVTITNSSVVTVPSGTAVIYCNNFTLDATSQIVVTPKGNDPRGTGATGGGTESCYCSGYGYVYGNYIAGGGSYGTGGVEANAISCPYGGGCGFGGNGGGTVYGIADDEAAPGAAGGTYGGSTTSGTPGLGGGLVAIYCNNITVQGTITANGQGGTGSAGGGSGGGVVLRASGNLDFSGSVSVAGAPGGSSGGGAGGNGVVKLLYGNSDTISGTVVGQKFTSFMPPFDVSSATHPDPTHWYNDAYASFDLAWSQPFTNAAGFYYALNTTYGFVPTPANSIFVGGEAKSYVPSALVAGTNYFHVDTVGPFANVGTMEHRYAVNINSTPPTIASSSHPSSTTWYANSSPYFSWTLPHAAADVTNFYWVYDPYASTIPDTTANKIPMDLTTPQNSEQLLLPNQANGIWYFHVIAQDTMGYLTKQAGSYRVQIGSNPGFGSVSGSVTDATTGNPLTGVSVTLNRGVQTATTTSNGAYAFTSDVYAQQYEVRASFTGYKDSVQTATVTSGQTTVVSFQMSH